MAPKQPEDDARTPPAIRARPGSAAAEHLGCRCPVLINSARTAAEDLLIAPDCAMHRPDDRSPAAR